MTLPVIVSDGGHASPPAPREPVPAVGQGIFNVTNLLRPDIQDSIQIFTRIVASGTRPQFCWSLLGIRSLPLPPTIPLSPAGHRRGERNLSRGPAPISPKLGRVPVCFANLRFPVSVNLSTGLDAPARGFHLTDIKQIDYPIAPVGTAVALEAGERRSHQ
jgi:hypothetical protein